MVVPVWCARVVLRSVDVFDRFRSGSGSGPRPVAVPRVPSPLVSRPSVTGGVRHPVRSHTVPSRGVAPDSRCASTAATTQRFPAV
ncbi:hypothetical protein GCM10027160_53190 [Streptomyces calidiresistens]